ncbi:MAG: hypothetical protein IKU28_04825 [Erysipelotrichaceae bacterium]|nr:hypothetical protein [Erysipelotrichaceae bacterium]
MNKVVLNALKMTMASMIAVFLAKSFYLNFYLSAGIVTVLTIQNTKRETLRTAETRFFAFLIANWIALISFTLCGINEFGFSLYLFVYLVICFKMKWYSSMAMNSVLMTHYLSFGEMSLSTVWNETLLFCIGVGCGLVANLHLRQDKDTMNQLKCQTDEQITMILKRISMRVLSDVGDVDESCFDVLNDLITSAKIVAKENEDNVLLSRNDDHRYIRMRERQSQILVEMLKIIRKIHTTPVTAECISCFIHRISEEYSDENDCVELLQEFELLNQQLKKAPLPVTRNEFEERARLFGLLRLIEEFLKIKRSFVLYKSESFQ